MPLPQSRRNIRIANIARYRISGRLSDKAIAELVGMTPAGLKVILQTPEYLEVEEALLEGRVSQMDEALAGDIENIKDQMRVAVPVAARALIETVQQSRDLRARLAAAKEILDRDPDHILSPIRQVQPPAGSPGGAFNPEQAGTILASMTVDANKVTAQLQATPPSPVASNSPTSTPVDTIVPPSVSPISPGTSDSSGVAHGD